MTSIDDFMKNVPRTPEVVGNLIRIPKNDNRSIFMYYVLVGKETPPNSSERMVANSQFLQDFSRGAGDRWWVFPKSLFEAVMSKNNTIRARIAAYG